VKIREQQTTVKTVLVRPKTGGAPVKMLMQTSSMGKQFAPPGAVFHPSMMRGIRMPSMGLMNGGGGSPLKPPFPMAARILSVGQSQHSPVKPVSATNPSPLRKSVNSPTKSPAVSSSSSRFGPVDANSTSNELRQLIASLRAENSRLNDSLRREKASHDSLVSQLKSAHNSQIAAKDHLIAGRDTRIDELRQQVEMLHRDLANSNNERLRLINASEQ